MKPRILYVGTIWQGSTTVQRRTALEDIGFEVVTVDTGWRQMLPALSRRIAGSIRRRLGYPMELMGENRVLLETAKTGRFDILWVDKGLTVRPSTLTEIRRIQPDIITVFFSADDMSNPQNQSRYYLKSLPLYDIHITTKTPNVRELKARGAREVIFMDNGYDPHTHRPIELRPGDAAAFGADIGFVGGYEAERADDLFRLASDSIPVRVWGNRWHLQKKTHPLLVLEKKPVFGDDYARVLCATKINLAFLRKVNRDRQTTRSIEIPACGAFMLAERTEEHLRLFDEGKEAEFFSSHEELTRKIRYYLKDDARRREIAEAGRTRCLVSGYSYQERLRNILNTCLSLRAAKGMSL